MKINHSSEVLSALKSSINSSTLNDVQILVGKEKKVFYASSLLLATCSPIFKAIFFTSKFIEQHTKQLELPDANPTSFLSFLEYLTIGEIELTGQVKIIFFKKINSYLKIFHFLQIKL
jgi:hypothetical protein